MRFIAHDVQYCNISSMISAGDYNTGSKSNFRIRSYHKLCLSVCLPNYYQHFFYDNDDDDDDDDFV